MSGVDQVEAGGRRRVGRHVVAQHLDHAPCDLPGPGHVDVGGDHPSRGTDALGQPEGYGRPDPGLQPLSCPDVSGPEQRLANRLRSGFRTLMEARGADLAYGRTLPGPLREAGLADVRADAHFPIASPACAVLESATVRQIRHLLVAEGLATDAEIDRHLANVATGRLDLATAPMVSARGRRP